MPIDLKKLLIGAPLLVLLALGLGLGFNLLRWDGRSIPLRPEYLGGERFKYVSLAEAARLHRQKDARVLFLDARSRLAYLKNHIRGAKYLFPAIVPEARIDSGTGAHKIENKDYFKLMYPYMRDILKQYKLIVIYGRTLSYNLAGHLAWRLRKQGHHNLVLLDARFADWEAAGLPVSRPRRGPTGPATGRRP